MGVSVSVASKTSSDTTVNTASETTVAGVSVPQGLYKNGNDFIIVRDTWVRIVISGNKNEYDFTAQMDPWGNYALRLSNGGSITIYSNGKALNYNGTTYSK